MYKTNGSLLVVGLGSVLAAAVLNNIHGSGSVGVCLGETGWWMGSGTGLGWTGCCLGVGLLLKKNS